MKQIINEFYLSVNSIKQTFNVPYRQIRQNNNSHSR